MTRDMASYYRTMSPGKAEEINAMRKRIEVAKKAKLRSEANLKKAEAAFDSARKLLNAAISENTEASNNLKVAKATLAALKDRKYDVVDLCNDDEFNDDDDNQGEEDPITQVDLDNLTPESRVIIYEYKTGKYFGATIKKLGCSSAPQERFLVHIDGNRKNSRKWLPKAAIARIL